MGEKIVVKLIGQTTIINTETNEETVQPITIIQEAVTNVVNNTTVIIDSPLIAEMKDKLDTIQEGAQVNPNMTPIIRAIDSMTTELNNHKVSTSNPHQTTKEQVGLKLQSGDVTFANESSKIVLFPTNYFSTAPNVLLTL